MIYADMSSYIEIVCLLLDTFGFDLCLIFAALLCKLLRPCIIKSSLIKRKLPVVICFSTILMNFKYWSILGEHCLHSLSVDAEAVQEQSGHRG